VADRAVTRGFQQLLLCAALLSWALVCPAADALQTAPTAHSPLLMLYVRQPLGAPAGSRVYGLRLDQVPSVPSVPTVPALAWLPTTGPIAANASHDIVDLQIRRYSDVRLELGRRLTWDIGREEFGASNSASSTAIRPPTRANLAALAVRAQP
jgi:hypothetical protein